MTTTAADAALSVHDPATATAGHLVNGSYVMPQPLQVRADVASPFAPVGGGAATPLLSYPGPKSARSRRDHVQATGVRHGRPALRRVREDARLHVVGRDSLTTFRRSARIGAS